MNSWPELGLSGNSAYIWLNGPTEKTRKLLAHAESVARSVPYKVSLRWLFYRIWQEKCWFKTKDKDRAYGNLAMTISRAVHNNYWDPRLLADETRTPVIRGEGCKSADEWLSDFKGGMDVSCVLDKRIGQEYSVIVVFEAAAMHSQFDHYCRSYYVDLWPFKGQASNPYKARLADRIMALDKKYGNEVVVLYFGDYDYHGMQIPESAFADVREWANCAVTIKRIGLNSSPDDNEFQWEALDDEAARDMILGALDQFVNVSTIEEILQQEDEAEAKVLEALESLEI